MYERIGVKLQGVQQALKSSRTVSIVPLPSGELELGDELAQLHRLVDTVKSHLRQAEEETKKTTQALKQVQGILIEQCNVVEQENISL
jgi:hypothetical protein